MTHPTYEHFWKFNNVNNILDIFFNKDFGKEAVSDSGQWATWALEHDAFKGVQELFDTLGNKGLKEEEIYTLIIRQLEKRWSNTIWEGDEFDEVDIDGRGIQSFGLRRSI